ncbi:MAG: hypothetical protein IJT96_11995 [Lachnospiraceae bacterium]|nr:hypothetical protein [Lachnospiraceae bacterium]
MKSIRSKILGVVFVSVTFTALILLIICVVSMSVINERDSNMLLEHIGMEHATAIDMQLEGIEHSVDSIYYYAIDRLEENASRLNDEAFRTEYIDKIRELSLSEARNTESVKVVYFRLSTDIKEPPYGFIYQANDRTGVLRSVYAS